MCHMDNTKTAVDWKSLLGAGLAAGAAGALPFIGSIRRGESLRAPSLEGGQLVDDPTKLPGMVQPGDIVFHGDAIGGSPTEFGGHIDMITHKNLGIYTPGFVRSPDFELDPADWRDTVILRPKLDPQRAKALKADLQDYGRKAKNFNDEVRAAILTRNPQMPHDQAQELADKMNFVFFDMNMGGAVKHEMLGGGMNPQTHLEQLQHFEPIFESVRNPAKAAKHLVANLDLSNVDTAKAGIREMRETCAIGRCSTSPAMLLARHGMDLGVNRNLMDVTPHTYLNSPNFEPVAYYLKHPEARGQLFGTPIQRLKGALSLGLGGTAGLAAYGIGRLLNRKPAPLPWNVRLKQHLMAGEFGPAYGAAKEGMGAALRRLGLHR